MLKLDCKYLILQLIEMLIKFLNTLFFLLMVMQVFAEVRNFSDSTNQPLKVKHTTDFYITGDGSAYNWASVEWLKLPQRSGKVSYEKQVKIR